MSAHISQLLHTYVLSGGGVTAIRTRDPMATIQAVVAFQMAQNKPLKIWDPARGWLDGTDPFGDKGNGMQNLVSAFQNILSPDTSDVYLNDCVYVFNMVHHHISSQRPNPELFQLVSLLAHTLPSVRTDRRVLLCVPPSYTFPAELRELVPVIDHAAPGTDELADTIEDVLSDMQSVRGRYIPDLSENDMLRLAQASAGMIAPELENSFSRVILDAATRREVQTAETLRAALLREKSDMVKRSRALEVMPAVSLDQVGGLEPLKAWVASRVRAMDPAAWEQGVDKPKGCALVGPPGTGKSLLGKVIGGVLGVATIRFDISAVFQGLVGSSEENMREALFMLESLAPCVVLLDEIDKVVSTGAGGDSGVSQKVLGSLLTFMQETTEPIFWVPTMNRTENVPAELMRAGRLDEVFGVARPNEQEREAILRIHLEKRKVDVDALGDVSEAVEAMKGFVGAEIEGVASAARLAAFNEDTDVSVEHLIAAAKATKPLASKMPEQFEAMEQWCREHTVPANAPKAVPQKQAAPRRRRAVMPNALPGTDRKRRVN